MFTRKKKKKNKKEKKRDASRVKNYNAFGRACAIVKYYAKFVCIYPAQTSTVDLKKFLRACTLLPPTVLAKNLILAKNPLHKYCERRRVNEQS